MLRERETQENTSEEPVFESGRVSLSTGNVEVLEVNLTSKEIDVDIEDKRFVKRVMKIRGEISIGNSTAEETEGQEKKSPSPLATLRTVAEALSNRGITLKVCFKGNPVVTIGAEAKPTLLQLITKTRAVAINSFYRLIQMIV